MRRRGRHKEKEKTKADRREWRSVEMRGRRGD